VRGGSSQQRHRGDEEVSIHGESLHLPAGTAWRSTTRAASMPPAAPPGEIAAPVC